MLSILTLPCIFVINDQVYDLDLRNLIYKNLIFFQAWDTTSISLTAGCDLFMSYVNRTSAGDYDDFDSAKSRVLERAEKFGEISYKV